MGEPDLTDVAGPLYALPLTDFVAARTAAAKDVLAAGPATAERRALASAVRSLPKPSVAAWAVNMLAAHRPGTLRELASLGSSMRAAQAGLDTETLRSLSQQRKRLLSAAVGTARAVAEEHGRRISGAVAAEVEQTLRAATADQGAAEAVQSGVLLRSLAADGLFDVDLSGAVAAQVRRPAGIDAEGQDAARDDATDTETSRPAGQPRLSAVQPKARPRTPAALDRALAELKDAERAAAAAAEEAVRRSHDLSDAAASVARLTDEVGALQAQLARAADGLKRARKALEAAEADALQSARSADKARRKEALARERVLRLGNTPEQ